MGTSMTKELVTSPSSRQENPPAQPESLGKRVARWASNVFVSGVILIVGLVFGREVIHWWRSPDEAAVITAPASEAGGDELTLQSASEQLMSFGNFPHTLRRSELSGNLRQVLDHLQRTSREVLSDQHAFDSEAGPAELRMLSGTAKLTPVDNKPGEWSIYELQAPLPMVVGIREASPQVAAVRRRVVSWGMAFPSVHGAGESPASWTLFTYTAGSAEVKHDAEFSLAAPGFGRMTLSVRTDSDGTITGFRGFGSTKDWMAFYDEWFANKAWQTTDRWQSADTTVWSRRFEHKTVGTIDFLLSADDAGSVQALAVYTPQITTTETR